MHLPSLIEKKRDGGDLLGRNRAGHLRFYSRRNSRLPDARAGDGNFFRGMSDRETWHLTKAMLESGQIFEYPPNSPPRSTNTRPAQLAERLHSFWHRCWPAMKVWVPMISGRGLDITGGTLDKLESIPGFNVNLDRTRAIKQLERIGVFMIGQTAEICPADKKLYALRDVTGTVPSRPLIVASIMCKKLAENLDRLV